MDIETARDEDRPVIVDYVRMPDTVPLPPKREPPQSPRDTWRVLLPNTPTYMQEGVYDAFGRRLGDLTDHVPGARVYIEFAGVTFIWAVFGNRLGAGQRGDMFFTNIPGTAPITPFFTEWDPSSGFPRIGSALFTLIAAQRSNGAAKIVGRNTGDADLHAAACLIISTGVGMPFGEWS
jgi:hypothetical protein